jgi:hypothetical protein
VVTYRHTHVDGVEVLHKSDPQDSISVWLGRTRYDGMLAAVVESYSAKTQISALLDLIDLHLSGKGAGNGIALLLDQPHPEATAALEVLRDAATLDVPVHLLRYDGHAWVPTAPSNFDHAIADPHYRRWPRLLGADFTVPDLVTDLVNAVGLPDVRAYPQLTAGGEWSIRVEGLQVGRVLANGTGWLDVGKLGKTGEHGPERSTWLEVSPRGRLPFDTASLATAADKIREFATTWRARAGGEQNEHVLESRILRGAVDVIVDGRKLDLIRDDDGVVNWGSQFPTKWGPGRPARYLDALLRDPVDPRVPWAIEMKVRLSEGQYYRQAVAQAVLYRHFIRLAEPLHFWFRPYGLDATRCRAAVVVPEFRSSTWQARLEALCSVFEVALAMVPEVATHR